MTGLSAHCSRIEGRRTLRLGTRKQLECAAPCRNTHTLLLAQAMMQGVMQQGGLAAFQDEGLSSSMGPTDPSVYHQPVPGIAPSATLPMQFSHGSGSGSLSAGKSATPGDAPHQP